MIPSTIFDKNTDDTGVASADTSSSLIKSKIYKTKPDDLESTSTLLSNIFDCDSNLTESRYEKVVTKNEMKGEVKQIEDEKTPLLPTIKKNRVLPALKRKELDLLLKKANEF